jgi:hypothetical protein
VRASLVCGRRYRATVEVPPALLAVLSADMLATELRRYQLFGRVTPTRTGYQVEAEFRGRTGSYVLPDQVTRLENMA